MTGRPRTHRFIIIYFADRAQKEVDVYYGRPVHPSYCRTEVRRFIRVSTERCGPRPRQSHLARLHMLAGKLAVRHALQSITRRRGRHPEDISDTDTNTDLLFKLPSKLHRDVPFPDPNTYHCHVIYL